VIVEIEITEDQRKLLDASNYEGWEFRCEVARTLVRVEQKMDSILAAIEKGRTNETRKDS
jgi:hypothetical protein